MSHPVMEFSEITPNITIGTNMCCSIHGARLVKDGYNADIDLEEERQESPPEIETYVWLPTKDNYPPSHDQLTFGVQAITGLVSLQKKIYIHCHNGHGRSTVLVAAYFISTGMSLHQALEAIRMKRPEIHLHERQRAALHNFESN